MRAQIEAKFRTYARSRIADSSAEEIIRTVRDLVRLDSTRSLTTQLRAADSR